MTTEATIRIPTIKRTLRTFETCQQLRTASQYRKALELNRRDHSLVNDAFIEAGRGHWRNEETDAAAKSGDALSLLYWRLRDESIDLHARARTWFGCEPCMV